MMQFLDDSLNRFAYGKTRDRSIMMVQVCTKYPLGLRERWVSGDVTKIRSAGGVVAPCIAFGRVWPGQEHVRNEASRGHFERKRHGVGRNPASVVARQDAQLVERDQEGRLRQVAHCLGTQFNWISTHM